MTTESQPTPQPPNAPPPSERDWTEDFAHENGQYWSTCHSCQNSFQGHKRRVTCKLCGTQPPPPDELEQAIETVERLAHARGWDVRGGTKPHEPDRIAVRDAARLAVREAAQRMGAGVVRQQPHTCPVCNGQATVSKPPQIPGDTRTWSSGSIETWPCRACRATGIVWSPNDAAMQAGEEGK